MIEVVGGAPLVGGVVNKKEVALAAEVAGRLAQAGCDLRDKVDRLSSKDKEWVAILCEALAPPQKQRGKG